MRLAQILIVLMAWWMLNNINEYKDDRYDKDNEDEDEDDKQMSIMSLAVPKMNMNLIKKIMTMVKMEIPGKEAGPRM